MAFGCLLTLFATLIVQAFGLDPCNHYQLLHEPRRHVSSVERNSDKLLCDMYLHHAWYRFTNSDMSFGTCIQPYHCSTHVPLWVNGTIPTVSDGIVTRTACGTGTFNSDASNCCQHHTPIAIKNCGGFLVYELRGTPGCSTSYCTGHSLKCPQHKYSATGFQPCVAGYPNLTDKPHLSNPIITGNKFMFTCEVPYPRHKMDASFEVTWMLNGKPIAGVPSVTLTGNQRVAELYNDKLAGNLNKDLTCAVSTSYTDHHTGGMVSPPLTSNSYWAGIKLSTQSVNINEVRPSGAVSVISTIPIVCSNPGQTDCKVNIHLGYNSVFLTTNPCKVQLTPTSWNQMTHTAMATFHVTTNPSLVPLQHMWGIHVAAFGHGTGNMFPGHQLPTVQVHLTSSRPSAQCISTGDPHIKTFDQKTKRYNNFQVGQFTMVQRRTTSFRVEARTWKCGKVSCNCGVAMREGDDVITVDMCDGQYGKGVAKLEIKNPAMFTNKTHIVKTTSGNGYVVTFVSGASVKILIRPGRLLDLYITVPGTFFRDTEGLCGYFDGDIRNELTRKDGTVDAYTRHPNLFISSWSVPIGTSLFEKAEPLPLMASMLQQGPKGCSNNNKPNPTTDVCPSCVPVTGTDLISPTPTPTPSSMTGVTHVSPSPTSPYHFATSGTHPNPTTMVDKVTAETKCNHTIQNYPSINGCLSFIGFGYKDILDMCVHDIQLTNDSSMALSALTDLLEQCAHHIMITGSVIQNGTIVVPQHAKTCLGACSGNGHCNSGTCVCFSGFKASDCSVDSRKPPVITDVIQHVCDTQKQQCYEPILVGSNMMHSTDAKCYVTEMQTTTNQGSRGFALPSKYNTRFMSTSNVKCQIPKPTQEKAIVKYFLSLVNNKDGTTSNNVTYLLFNSKCQTCDQQFNCQTKPGTCTIDNMCYLKGDQDLQHNTGTCKPDVDQTSWTPSGSTSVITTTTPLPVVTTTPSPSTVVDTTPDPDNGGQGNSNILTLPFIIPGVVDTTPNPSTVVDTTPDPGNGGQGNSNILTLPFIIPGVVDTTPNPSTVVDTTPDPGNGGQGNSNILTLPFIIPGVVDTTPDPDNGGQGNSNILTLPFIIPGVVDTTPDPDNGGQGNSNILTLPFIIPGVVDTTPDPGNGGEGNSNILTLPFIIPGVVDTTPDPGNGGEGNSNILTLPFIIPGVDNTTPKPGNGGQGNSNILTLPPIIPGSFGVGKINYTAAATGCACVFDSSMADCACCQNFGCPCPEATRHHCYNCVNAVECGK